MSDIHLYTSPHQEAMRYSAYGEPDIIVTNPCARLIRAQCCGKCRWASHLTVQTYYDGDRFWCKKGTGCKKP